MDNSRINGRGSLNDVQRVCNVLGTDSSQLILVFQYICIIVFAVNSIGPNNPRGSNILAISGRMVRFVILEGLSSGLQNFIGSRIPHRSKSF